MNKNIALLLVTIVITSLLFTACNSKTTVVTNAERNIYTMEIKSEEDVLSYIEELMPIAEEFYQIYYRCSLKTDDYDYDSVPISDNGFKYVEVKDKYSTLSDLESDTKKYFSDNYLKNFFFLDTIDVEYSFYKDINGKLYKNIDVDSVGKNKWITGNATIQSFNDKEIIIDVPYIDLYDSQKSGTVTLVYVKGNWKIDKWVV